MKKRVVITGIGVVSPLGFNKTDLWASLLTQKLSLTNEEYCIAGQEPWGKFWAHRIKNFDINNFGIDTKELDYLKAWKKGAESKILNYLLAAAKLAIDDSKIKYNREDNDIGCFVTVENPDFESFCEHLICDAVKAGQDFSRVQGDLIVKAIESVYGNNEARGYDLHSFMYLYFIAKIFGFHGYSLFTNNACASGLFALEEAARHIMLGKSPIAIAVGGEAGINMYKYRWFKDKGIYAEDGLMKPFSEYANGLVLGEGASAIILEEYQHAKRRKADIYCEYLGGAFNLEGWKVLYPNLVNKYYYKVIKQALGVAGITARAIDLINPHGVGMKVTDAYEAKAFADIFSSSSKKPYLTAFKPYIGHALGGSALIETIILILSMRNNIVLPLLNCQKPIKMLKNTFFKESQKKNIRVVLKTSCGFAGYNGAVVLRKI